MRDVVAPCKRVNCATGGTAFLPICLTAAGIHLAVPVPRPDPVPQFLHLVDRLGE